MGPPTCPWCQRAFEPVKRAAHAKRFCSARCKHAFESAARRYAYAMVDAGLLSVSELKRVSASRATPGTQEPDFGVSG